MHLAVRALDGKLSIRTLDVKILLDEMFYLCRNDVEVEFMADTLRDIVELLAWENLDRLNEMKEEF